VGRDVVSLPYAYWNLSTVENAGAVAEKNNRLGIVDQGSLEGEN
jgi:hypothetical protein